MSHGLPRTSKEVVREAAKLGYAYVRSTGGHMFYAKANPDASLGQSAKLCIPTDIKAEKTLRSILKGMGYFKANNLNAAGQPLAEKFNNGSAVKSGNNAADRTPDPAETKKPDVQDIRRWKRDMKRFARGLSAHPGAQP